MSVRSVVRIPARVLKQPAEPVGAALGDALVVDLIDTMRASPACVGLAAPQIGVSKRVIVVDVTGHPRATVCHGLTVVVDPVVIRSTGTKVGREGCMSAPDLTAHVARATSVVVQGTSPDGGQIVVATEGFETCAFQHEIDHLDGMLILDRVESLATDVVRRKTYR